MTSRLFALSVDALDPPNLARFWAGLFGWELDEDTGNGIALLPADDTGFRLRFLPTQEEKSAPNQMHFDLTSTSAEDQQQQVARALELGAEHLDVGQSPEEGHVVLADPEGNEFCVLEPGNTFLAECGFVGALASDGTQEVGYFWSAVLGWPLVWDQDEETAIRSPHGGPKFTWGGPPVRPKAARNRLHFDLVPCAGNDQLTEVRRRPELSRSSDRHRPRDHRDRDARRPVGRRPGTHRRSTVPRPVRLKCSSTEASFLPAREGVGRCHFEACCSWVAAIRSR